jgi:NADH dehydrogenase FAD-containing subunit
MQSINADKNPQGRIKVDEYMRLADDCYVAGDAAYVPYKDGFLRMAVQFAITEGHNAASNIINSIRGLPLTKFKPVDMGYIIPMANNRSCGEIMRMRFKGKFATFLHFIMCIYRSCGIRKKLGIIKGLI